MTKFRSFLFDVLALSQLAIAAFCCFGIPLVILHGMGLRWSVLLGF